MKTKSRPKYAFNRVATNLLFVILGTIFALTLIEVGTRVFIIVLKRSPIVCSDSQAGWKGRPDLRNLTKSYLTVVVISASVQTNMVAEFRTQ